jgi:hypothetical protein
MLPFPNNSTTVYTSNLIHEGKWNFEKRIIVTRFFWIFYLYDDILAYNINLVKAKTKSLYLFNLKIPDFITNFLVGKVFDDEFEDTFKSFRLVKNGNKREVYFVLNHKSKKYSNFDFKIEGKIDTDLFDTNEFIQQNQVNPCVTKLIREC